MPQNNNHASRKTAEWARRSEYETLEAAADSLGHELAHAVRCAIYDLKALRAALSKIKGKNDAE